ncbi:MAG: hypothetical protein ABJQ72_02725, partial [Nitratireductor sp.]
RYAGEVSLRARDWTCSTRFVARTAARLAAAHDTMMEESERHSLLTLPPWEGQTVEDGLGRARQ